MANDFQGFTPEWLEGYRRRLAGFEKRTDADLPQPKIGKRRRTVQAQPPRETRQTAAYGSRARKGGLAPYRAAKRVAVPSCGYGGKQTETEKRYNRDVLGGIGRFEAVSLYLPGGGRYTPDFMTVDDGLVTFHEVKGAYRLNSQGRAHTAFFEAAAAFPMWRFVWATERAKKDGGGFAVRTFDPKTTLEGND